MFRIVVVGGGSAGWITANLLAAEFCSSGGQTSVTLIESPDVPIIGVGEGTWPSMRSTLQKIGFPEDELFVHCDASFKQGTTFDEWSGISDRSTYHHPFTPPVDFVSLNPAQYWLATNRSLPFTQAVTPQAMVIDHALAPKQASTPPYAFAVNYAYHFDAGQFALRLHRHGTQQLGVQYVSANVDEVLSNESGDIAELRLDIGTTVAGELFIDCTGQRALLIGDHFGIPLKSVQHQLFNDAAVVTQVPYLNLEDTIKSTTLSTATGNGWIWDIGLQSRRGVGYVYSSEHLSDSDAENEIRRYVEQSNSVDSLDFRQLRFAPGYREDTWVRNCVAVGLSAGFVEPLEASAIALVEQAANLIVRSLRSDPALMPISAKRFNGKMCRHWERIIEFLKLHYVLSRRDDSEYWLQNRRLETCPGDLTEKLKFWRTSPPYHDDAPMVDELFPSASYQYVLYGMGFEGEEDPLLKRSQVVSLEQVDRILQEKVIDTGRKMVEQLPSNRELIAEIINRNASKEHHV